MLRQYGTDGDAAACDPPHSVYYGLKGHTVPASQPQDLLHEHLDLYDVAVLQA